MRYRACPPPHFRAAFGPWARSGLGGFPSHFGPGWGRYGSHGARRGRRGDVRVAILLLLAEKPRHGYDIINEIAGRSNGFWKPSPGSVYPTLQMLADEGFVTSQEEDGKRLFALTKAGQTAASELGETPPWEQATHDVDQGDVDLRQAGAALLAAAIQVSQAAHSAQKARAVEVLNEARRTLYAILGETPGDSDTSDDNG